MRTNFKDIYFAENLTSKRQKFNLEKEKSKV